MIERAEHQRAVRQLLAHNPVVALLGARQVGKTTLARALAAERDGAVHVFDLESSADLARLADPALALWPLRGLVVLDGVRRRPDLLPALRTLADRLPVPARFLVLGSASPELLRRNSEALGARIACYELPPLSLAEVQPKQARRLWLRGGLPRAFAPRGHAESARWRRDFMRAFLERELPQLGIKVPSARMERFWTMLAHRHAQVWNGSQLARALQVSHHAARRYLDALQATFMVRRLKPWRSNLGKRQVKAPKVYVRDSGLLHNLLNIVTFADLERHPKAAASWEGFVVENLIRTLGAEERDCYFWATHAGAEIDLLVRRGTELRGFLVKRATAPGLTRSIYNALDDLELARLDVIHAGDDTFPLAPRVQAVSANRMPMDL